MAEVLEDTKLDDYVMIMNDPSRPVLETLRSGELPQHSRRGTIGTM